MKILISSLIDLQKSSHNSRLHQFVKYLSAKHEISVLSINDWWKVRWDEQSTEYQKDFGYLFEGIDYTYLTEKKISPVLQDVASIIEPKSIKSILKRDYDIHLSYNCLFCGYVISRNLNSKGVNTIYDLADDLPEMTRTSPQIPEPLKSLGGLVSRVVLRKNIRLAKKVTCTTESLSNIYRVPENKSVLIPNGVDTRLFKKYKSEGIKNKLGIEDCSFIVGHVGVLREWLDFEPLFEAFKTLSDLYNMKLLIVGGGIGYDETTKLAQKFGISRNVVFTGTVPYSHVPYYISCMDVGIIPFKLNEVSQNSLPLKLFEYMACEKPVISTNIKCITDNFNDLVLIASSSENYIDRIRELYLNEKLKESLGIRGRTKVVNNFDWSEIVLKLDKLINESAVPS